jgi:hypothetical protein
MSLDRNLSHYRGIYDEADENFRSLVDLAFDAAQGVIKQAGWPAAEDDTAENLVTAIVKYATISCQLAKIVEE